jgi:putative ABC transport system permease protein
MVLPGIGRLIGTGLAAHRSRTALTVACVGAVTAAVTLSITLTRSTAGTLDAWLEAVATIRRTPNVKAVFEEVSEEVVYRGEKALLVAGSMNVLARYGKLQVVRGSPGSIAAELAKGRIAISERFAQHFGKREGDFVTLNTPKGPRSLRVAGIIRDYAGPTGSLNIDLDIFEQLWPHQGSRDVVFWTLGDPASVVSAIQHRLTEKQPLLFSYGAKLAHFVTDQIWRVRGILLSVALLTALLGAVAVSSLMLSSVTMQSRDRSLLLATGATRVQVQVITLLEGFVVGVSGGIVGIALGISTSYVLISDVLPEGIGWKLDFYVDPAELLLVTLCLVMSSLLASAYPAWIAGEVSFRELSGE